MTAILDQRTAAAAEQWLDAITEPRAENGLAPRADSGTGGAPAWLAPRRFSSYEGGNVGRLTRDWVPPHRSADMAIFDSWWTLTPRVRDLLRNSPTVIGVQRELTKNVIGSGIQTSAAVIRGTTDGVQELDDEFNDEADDWFEEWAEEEADVAGQLSWYDMQRLVFDEVSGIGESLLLRCNRADRDRIVPLCYQVIEPEQIDQSRDQPPDANGVRIMRGVELDRFNRPLAYWLFDAYPWDGLSGWTGQSVRVPAERVIHPYVKFRPSQTRGISWFNALMQSARDVDWYVGNELTSAAIGALLSVLVKRATPARGGMGMADDAETSDDFGNELIKLGRGVVGEIGSDEDIKIVESNRPNRDAGPFIKLLMQLQGQSVGMSYLGFTGDFTGSSYTAARAAFLKDAALYRPLQSWFGGRVVKKVRREFTGQAVGFNRIRSVSAGQFLAQRRRWLRVEVMGPGREQLDPEKETGAAAGRMRIGVSALPYEAALLNRNWKKNLRDQARAVKYAEKLGVNLDFSNGASPPKTGQVGSDPNAGLVNPDTPDEPADSPREEGA